MLLPASTILFIPGLGGERFGHEERQSPLIHTVGADAVVVVVVLVASVPLIVSAPDFVAESLFVKIGAPIFPPTGACDGRAET